MEKQLQIINKELNEKLLELKEEKEHSEKFQTVQEENKLLSRKLQAIEMERCQLQTQLEMLQKYILTLKSAKKECNQNKVRQSMIFKRI